jgi:GntR family transcriptional regulator, transcriptional repressor for pyruvate dehydrogenase complex
MTSAHKFAPLEKEPAYRKIAKAIEGDIIAGRLQPGEALPTEEALSTMFALSRNTVREGLRVLELTGLVERGAAKRLRVAAPRADMLARNASKALIHSGVTFAQIFEALAAFQPQMAELATKKANDETIAALLQCIAGLNETDPADHNATLRAAVEFFEILAGSLDNPVLQIAMLSHTALIHASLEAVIDAAPNARDRILIAQTEITQAIFERNEQAAFTWMTRHIEDLRRGYEVAGVDMNARIG